MDHNFVRCTLSKFKVSSMRFYDIDGQELDVQDPKFFMDEEKYIQIKETLEDMINTYGDVRMSKYIQEDIS